MGNVPAGHQKKNRNFRKQGLQEEASNIANIKTGDCVEKIIQSSKVTVQRDQ